ncbi:MAG: holo-ACP synthase [Rhodocyclaceae bacterium]|nr:holo-ACP synthase [Rhodocyclaceae bacterium]
MIYGVGTDIVAVVRLVELYSRHGEKGVGKLLAPEERADCLASADPGRFLAKRFAAKEALGKALGLGVRAPATLPAIAVGHDAHGKPEFRYAPELAAYLAARGLSAHLSISDERDYAVAFVVVEKT